jgi:PPP family 3-phenylpropionic acid transporter
MSAARSPYWPLAGFYFFYFAYLGVFAPYFSLYLADRQLTAAAIGAVMALPQVMRIFAAHYWGWLADHRGARVPVARVAGLAGTLAFALIFAGDQLALIIAAIAVMSFFWSAALPIAEVTTLGHLGAHIGRYGRIRVWGSIGFIGGVVGVGAALDHVAIGVLPGIVLALMSAMLAFLWRVPDAPVATHAEDTPLLTRLRNPAVIVLFIACGLMAVAHGPYYTFFSLYLVDLGYSKTAVGMLWALGVVCEIAIFLAMPQLTRAFSLRAILIASFGLGALRFSLIAWGAQHLVLLIVAQTLHAASFGTFHASALGLVQQFFSGRQQARGQAAYSSLTAGVGGAVGALASGVLWEAAGPEATFGFAAACAAVGGLALWARLRV